MNDTSPEDDNADRISTGVPDTVLGLLFVIGGVVLAITGTRMEGLGGMTIGGGTLPIIIGCAFVLAGGVLAFQGRPEIAMLRRHAAVLFKREDFTWFPVTVLVSLGLYILLLESVGFLPLTFLFILLMIRIGGGGLVRGGLYAAFLTVFIYFLFVNGLRVPLPVGILG